MAKCTLVLGGSARAAPVFARGRFVLAASGDPTAAKAGTFSASLFADQKVCVHNVRVATHVWKRL